jgi:hypothetical protein
MTVLLKELFLFEWVILNEVKADTSGIDKIAWSRLILYQAHRQMLQMKRFKKC